MKRTIYYDTTDIYINCDNMRDYDVMTNYRIIGSNIYIRVAKAVFYGLV